MSDISAYSLSFVVEFKKDVQYTPHDRKAAEWYSKTEKKFCVIDHVDWLHASRILFMLIVHINRFPEAEIRKATYSLASSFAHIPHKLCVRTTISRILFLRDLWSYITVEVELGKRITKKN